MNSGRKADPRQCFLRTVEDAQHWGLTQHSQYPSGTGWEAKKKAKRVYKYAGIVPPTQKEHFSGKHQRNPHQFQQPEAASKPAG